MPSLVDLRSHVFLCSQVSLHSSHATHSCQSGCESEVNYFQIVILVEHQVFRLEISVGKAHIVALIEAFHELQKVKPGDSFGELSGHSDEIKKISAACILEDQVKLLNSRSISLNIRVPSRHLNQLDDVSVVDLLKSLKFLQGVLFLDILQKHLDGHSLPIWSFSFVNFAGGSRPYFLKNQEIADGSFGWSEVNEIHLDNERSKCTLRYF